MRGTFDTQEPDPERKGESRASPSPSVAVFDRRLAECSRLCHKLKCSLNTRLPSVATGSPWQGAM